MSVSLVEKIRELCEERGISISKLEKLMGFGNGTIYNWERSSPSIDKVAKVARYFGVSTDFLLGVTEENVNPDIRILYRAGKKLSEEDAKKLRQMAELMFPDLFKD